MSVYMGNQCKFEQSIDPGQSGCDQNPQSAYTCFQFSACFRLNSLVLASKSAMKIRFKIVAEPGKSVSRVWIRLADESQDDTEDNRKSKIEHTLVIKAQAEDYCTSLIG